MFWKFDKPLDAAKVIKSAGQRINFNHWSQSIASSFMNAYQKETLPEKITHAFDALIQQDFGLCVLSELHQCDGVGE